MDNIIFSVGQIISIETYYKAYLQTHVLGWKKDAFILTEAIYIQGQSANIKTDDICTVRFLKGDNAYGFKAAVLEVLMHPHPVMFLKYPDNVESVKLRVAPRIKVELPATFMAGSGKNICAASLCDISNEGCGLKVPLTDSKDLPPDAEYSIILKVMDTELKIQCSIKNILTVKDAHIIGLAFTNISRQNKEALSHYLDSLNKK
jgi:c-di-GMP-binding flagellar brake protein YcgR